MYFYYSTTGTGIEKSILEIFSFLEETISFRQARLLTTRWLSHRHSIPTSQSVDWYDTNWSGDLHKSTDKTNSVLNPFVVTEEKLYIHDM
jgi:hypothetical protein